MVEDLGDAVLSRRVLTVYGPSGAGKSSLLQAGVVPFLSEEWDLRCVVVDSWPADSVRSAGPAARLVEALSESLGLGEVTDLDTVFDRAFRLSDRPILLVLDQLEQLLAYHET
jgi:type II secretory pathway predicted ATPase ExeA